jgi:hypothetical protein
MFGDIEGRQCDPSHIIIGGAIVPNPISMLVRWQFGKEATRAVMGAVPMAFDTMVLVDLCLWHRSVCDWWWNS